MGSAGEAIADGEEATYQRLTVGRYARGDLVVRYAPGTSRAARTDVRGELGATVESHSAIEGLEVLDLPEGTSVSSAVAEAERLPNVLYAEPNYRVGINAAPNDPMFGQMWSLGLANSKGVNSGIGTPRVWNLTTGSPGVTVAVVDSGVDGGHPDLAPNMWSNPAEVPGNAKDDDANGLVDDAWGWDWVGKDNNPTDENGHGTHVAGIVGARGNNAAGVTGVNWEVRLMSLRVLDAAGSGWTSDVAEAFLYAGEMGADVVNASLAGNSFSQALLDSIAASPGTLFVVAAGNDSRDVGQTPSYPCSYPLPNVICVAASSQSNQLSSYSNFGVASVDLAAPGDAILSTWPGGTYNQGWGTSSATPHVAGMAALLGAHHPEASADRIRTAILAGAEPLTALAGRTVTGGRLSSSGAFEQMGDAVPEEQPPPDSLREDPRDQDQKKRRCATKRRGRNGRRARRACRARNSR
jgi:subtilisin family serine protease